ncbi:MAG: hypothetical protein ACI9UA_002902 [Pseudoalteromonas tetraodonis]
MITTLAVSVLGLVGLNLLMASSFGRGVLSRKVSGAMRLSVTVGSASWTPWGGARLKKLRVEQTQAAGEIVDDPFFSAASFEAEVKLFSLLSDEVVIDRLVCDAPTLSLVTGTVAVPQAKPAVGSEAPPAGRNPLEENAGVPREGVSQAGRETPVKAPVVVDMKRQRTVSLGEVEVNGGTVVVTSSDGTETLRIEGLRLVVDLSPGGKSGRMIFDRAQLWEHVEVLNFASPMEVAGKRMTLTDLAADCGGGKLSGEMMVEPSKLRTSFLANLSAVGVEIVGLFDGRSLGLKSGKIGADVSIRGTAQSLATIEGRGRIWVESAAVQPGAEFERLRSALRADGEGRVELDPAEATFAVQRGVLSIKEASFGSGRVLVKSVGAVRRDGALNVATRVYVGEDLYSAIRSKPVPGRPALEFDRLEGTDWFYRDEVVTGNVRHPLVDFWRTGEPVPASKVLGELSFDFDLPGGDAIGR